MTPPSPKLSSSSLPKVAAIVAAPFSLPPPNAEEDTNATFVVDEPSPQLSSTFTFAPARASVSPLLGAPVSFLPALSSVVNLDSLPHSSGAPGWQPEEARAPKLSYAQFIDVPEQVSILFRSVSAETVGPIYKYKY
jgi:hypothetical protein